MNRATLEWYELLARSLTWVAAIVLLLAAIAAIVIAGSDSAEPLFGDIEKQGRGVASLAALGSGLTGAGLLAAVSPEATMKRKCGDRFCAASSVSISWRCAPEAIPSG